MNRFTKLSLSLGGSLALLTLAGQNVFAVGMVNTGAGKAMWHTVSGAKYYNVYYKETADKKFTHAVRKLPQNATSFTISHLKNGVTYEYKVSALSDAGKEFWWSGVAKLGK